MQQSSPPQFTPCPSTAKHVSPEEIPGIRKLIREIAVEYAKAGLHVIPVSGKSPCLEGWPEKKLPPEEIAEMFFGSRNLGIVCGKTSGLVCIDLDEKSGGRAWFFENEDRLGRPLVEDTGGGGLHLYYRYPKGIDHIPSLGHGNKLMPGVELAADGGRQVITWPSIHPNGRQYTIHHGLTLLTLEDEADELPAWIVEIAQSKPAIEAREPLVGIELRDEPRELKAALETLKSLGYAEQGNGGDRKTYRAACLGPNHALTKETWLTVLSEWNTRCSPPWTEEDLGRKHRGAYEYGAKNGTIGKDTLYGRNFGVEISEDDRAMLEALPEIPATRIVELRKTKESNGKGKPNGGGTGSGDGGGKPTQKKSKTPHYDNPLLSAKWFLSDHPGLVSSLKRHFEYRNDCWQEIEKDTLRAELLLAMHKKEPRENIKPKHRDDAYEHIRAFTNRAHLAFDTWEDGRPGDYIRVENGILDLNKIQLLPHDPKWFSTTRLPFRYDPTAKCPEFLKFLESIWGETPDQIEALQHWMGYMMSSDYSHQCFALLLGPPRAGKGTIVDVMLGLIGEQNSLSRTIDIIGKNQFALGGILGKKMLLIPDAHEGTSNHSKTTAELIKMITGRDPVPIEEKNKPIVTIRPSAKIVLAANEMPRLADPRGALVARLVVFNLTQSFVGREDVELGSRLKAEMPGILNWAILGLHLLKQRGRMLRPESSGGVLDDIRSRLNPIERFFDDYIEFSDGACMVLDDAYQLYKLWCEDAGIHPSSKPRLSAQVASHFSEHKSVKRARVTLQGTGENRVFRMGFTDLQLKCTPSTYTRVTVNKDTSGMSIGAVKISPDSEEFSPESQQLQARLLAAPKPSETDEIPF